MYHNAGTQFWMPNQPIALTLIARPISGDPARPKPVHRASTEVDNPSRCPAMPVNIVTTSRITAPRVIASTALPNVIPKPSVALTLTTFAEVPWNAGGSSTDVWPAPGREAGGLHQLPGLGGGLDGRDDHAVDACAQRPGQRRQQPQGRRAQEGQPRATQAGPGRTVRAEPGREAGHAERSLAGDGM